MMTRLVFTLLVIFPLAGQATLLESKNGANPIRKVVNLLQAMVKKVEEEGDKQEAQYKKFVCYCKTGGGALEKSIAEAGIKAPELESSINEAESKKTQIGEDLKSHRADRQAAKDSIAEATSMREKDAAKFAGMKNEADTNIAAMTAAIAALEKGMAGFLQTSGAQTLKKIIAARQSMVEVDRQDVLSFLSGSDSNEYAPQSGQITGILKQLKDEMSADLADATKTENGAIAAFESLVAAKKKEIAALTSSIESKTQRGGELAVDIVEMKNSLDDTQAALLDDKKYLKDLEANCDKKAGEWDQIKKTRAEELVALHDTIKVLNDDDALDLFKKTLPSASASLLQVVAGNKDKRGRALSFVQQARAKASRPGFDFISLLLQGKSQGFQKVIKMIDEMIGTLKQEQVDDDDKKEYCQLEFDNSDDKKKGLERSVADLSTTIADTKDGIAKAKEEIAALTASISSLDNMVAEATAQRKEEHALFTELMSSNTAAKELLHFAKNRLNKFYNPKLYKPPPKEELSEEDRITVNMGGTLAPTPPPGGIANTGIGAFVQIRAHRGVEAPPPPPETFGAYTKKGEDNNGVIAMIDLLVKDLDKEMQEGEVDEENGQKEYEQTMSDSADKRAQDSKSLTDATSTKARLESDLQASHDDKKATTAELMATEKYISNLHGECDWLLQYFDARKEARAGEVDAMNSAKAVLSGADYALIQSASLRGTRRT